MSNKALEHGSRALLLCSWLYLDFARAVQGETGFLAA